MLLAACSPSLAPPAGVWRGVPAPPVGLVAPAVLGLGDGSALVLAGQSPDALIRAGEQSDPVPTVERFASGTWRLQAPEPEALSYPAIVILPNEDVLLVGGIDREGIAVPRAFLYDPRTNRWSRMPDMPAARAAPFAVLLLDGTVLVGGGAADSPNLYPQPSGLAAAWIFDPARQTWRSAGSMHTGRIFASATRLSDSTVLVAGGDDQGNPMASAEVFDPVRGSWTMVAPLPQARSQQVATLIGSHVVLMGGRAFTVFGGGFALNAALDAELYDIGSRSWSLGSPPTFSLSPEPYVAVASAVDHRLLALTSRQEAVAYDAGADYWSRITRPPSWQGSPALGTMASGQVLLLAGKSAWLFDATGNPRSGDSGPGKETVILFVIAGVLLFLIGVQRLFRGWRQPIR